VFNQGKKEKSESFRNTFIIYPLIKKIFRDFDRLRRTHGSSCEHACMLLTGDAGSGKSALIDYYQSLNPPSFSEGRYHHPVLVSRIPSKPTLETTINGLIKDLGQAGSSRRRMRNNAMSLTDSLILNLKSCGTELIIINEFQELIEFQDGKRFHEIANRLKYLNEEAGISIAIASMP